MFNKIVKWVTDLADSGGETCHSSKVHRHAIAIKSMRVIIVEDGEQWFAQSLDIDYAASGSTLESVKANFEKGLSATIKAHLKSFGSIERIMKAPNISDWMSLIKDATSRQYDFSMGECHILEDELQLPFGQIQYIENFKKAA